MCLGLKLLSTEKITQKKAVGECGTGITPAEVVPIATKDDSCDIIARLIVLSAKTHQQSSRNGGFSQDCTASSSLSSQVSSQLVSRLYVVKLVLRQSTTNSLLGKIIFDTMSLITDDVGIYLEVFNIQAI